MTTNDFSRFILEIGKQSADIVADETAAKEVAGFVSGSLVYRLYESLIKDGYNMDEVTGHFEMLCDTGNYYGALYFIFILADATNEPLPSQFVELTANHGTALYLAAALMEDWFDFHEDYGT